MLKSAVRKEIIGNFSITPFWVFICYVVISTIERNLKALDRANKFKILPSVEMTSVFLHGVIEKLR
jgi:hypothetical protein